MTIGNPNTKSFNLVKNISKSYDIYNDPKSVLPFDDTFVRSNGVLTSQRGWEGSNTFIVSNNVAINTPSHGATLFKPGTGTFDSTIENWTKYSNNNVTSDNGALKIEYVDSADGAYQYIRSTGDFTSNTVIGKWYRFEFDAWVNTGSVLVVISNATESYSVPITNVSSQTHHLCFIAKGTTDISIKTSSMGAGEIIWLDNLKLYELTESSLFVGHSIASSSDLVDNFFIRVNTSIAYEECAGVWFGDSYNPTNATIIFYDRSRTRLYIVQKTGASYVFVLEYIITYADGASIELRKINATDFEIAYNGVIAGSSFSPGTIGNYIGIFAIGESSTFSSLISGKTYAVNTFTDVFDRADEVLSSWTPWPWKEWEGSQTFRIAGGSVVNTPGCGINLMDTGKGIFTAGTEGWVPYGNNTITNTSGSLQITYISSQYGAYLDLNSTADLSDDLDVGDWYSLEYQAHVNVPGGISLRTSTLDEDFSLPITTDTPKDYNIIFKAKSTDASFMDILGMNSSGSVVWLDNIKLYKLNKADLFIGHAGIIESTFSVRASLMGYAGEQAGVWFGNKDNPTDYIVFEYDMMRGNIYCYQKLGSTFTVLMDEPISYIAGAFVEIQKASANTFRLWYNGTKIGDDIVATGIIDEFFGLFQTGSHALLDSFYYEETIVGDGTLPYSDNFIRPASLLTSFTGWEGSTTFLTSGCSAINSPGTGANLYAAGKGTFDSGTESWTAYSNNTIVNDTGTLKITYVDSSSGAYSYLRAESDLSTDLTVWEWYRLDFDAWVNTGDVSVAVSAGGGETHPLHITNTSRTTHHIIFKSKSTNGGTIAMSGMGAGEIIWLDNLKLYKITQADMFAGHFGKHPNAIMSTVVAKAAITVGDGEQVGVWIGDASNPTNAIVAMYDPQRQKVQAYKKTLATSASFCDGVVTYVPEVFVEIRKTAIDTYQIWYDSTQVGTDYTVTAVGNVYFGIFQTGANSKVNSFYCGTSATDRAVAYFGGSITYGNLATNINTLSWRALTGFGLNDAYLDQRIKHINSGVGGTDSWYGLCRLQTDVIAHNPDLVLVEFAVNDQNSLFLRQAEEAMIRRIRTELPNTKIAFLVCPNITSNAGNNATPVNGVSIASWKAVCDLYGVPYYDFATYSKSLVDAGVYTCSQIWSDTKHPLDLGHSIAANGFLPLLTGGLLTQANQWTGPLPARIYDDGNLEATPIAKLGTDYDSVTGTWTVPVAGSVQSSVANSTVVYSGNFESFGLDCTGTSAQYKIDAGAYVALDSSTLGGFINNITNFTLGAHTITIKVISGTLKINKFYAI